MVKKGLLKHKIVIPFNNDLLYHTQFHQMKVVLVCQYIKIFMKNYDKFSIKSYYETNSVDHLLPYVRIFGGIYYNVCVLRFLFPVILKQLFFFLVFLYNQFLKSLLSPNDFYNNYEASFVL